MSMVALYLASTVALAVSIPASLVIFMTLHGTDVEQRARLLPLLAETLHALTPWRNKQKLDKHPSATESNASERKDAE